jgi:hypothetical protein
MDRRSVHEPFATRSSHRDQYIAVLVLLKAALNGRMGLGWLHSGLFRNLGTRKLTNGSGLTNPVHLNRGGTLGGGLAKTAGTLKRLPGTPLFGFQLNVACLTRLHPGTRAVARASSRFHLTVFAGTLTRLFTSTRTTSQGQVK